MRPGTLGAIGRVRAKELCFGGGRRRGGRGVARRDHRHGGTEAERPIAEGRATARNQGARQAWRRDAADGGGGKRQFSMLNNVE